MSKMGSLNKPAKGQNLINLTVLKVATQVGCLTFLIILIALGVGLWVDQKLDTRPLFTIIFMVGSMPVTWVAIFWVVNRSKQQILTQPRIGNEPKEQEDENSDPD